MQQNSIVDFPRFVPYNILSLRSADSSFELVVCFLRYSMLYTSIESTTVKRNGRHFISNVVAKGLITFANVRIQFFLLQFSFTLSLWSAECRLLRKNEFE